MLTETDVLEDDELVLIYIAKRLKEALALEKILEEASLDYDVQPDTYRGGIIFVTERVGAFFYVHPEDADAAREVMRANRFKPHKL
jgi:hypothetical protein